MRHTPTLRKPKFRLTENYYNSVLSVCSVVDYPYLDSFTQKKLKSLQNMHAWAQLTNLCSLIVELLNIFAVVYSKTLFSCFTISAGLFATTMPAFSKAAIFSRALPPPFIIAPA